MAEATKEEAAKRVWAALGGDGDPPVAMADKLAELHDDVREAAGAYDIGEVGDCGRMAEHMAKWLNVSLEYDD